MEVKPCREAQYERRTLETQITACVNLDGTGVSSIVTGVGFLEHMLTAFSKHSAIDIDLSATGDLHIDAHHTVEDSGVVLGTAMRMALGEMLSIRRYGYVCIPMDEVLILAAVDLCSRPHFHWDVRFHTQSIGGFDTELIREWFRGFALNSGASVHIKMLHGENSHHIAEACFKAFGRACRQAIKYDGRITGVVSTKGVL